MAVDQQILDILAGMEEPQALRKRADLRNVAWFRLFLVFSAVANFIVMMETIHNGPLGWMIAISIAMFILPVLLFLVVRKIKIVGLMTGGSLINRIAGFIERYPRAWILSFVVLQFIYLQIIVSDSESLTWVVIFPILMWPFRLLPSETILLYGSLFGVVALYGLVIAVLVGGGEPEVLVGGFVWSSIALAISLIATRRWKKRFLSEWSAARERYTEERRMRQELEFAREIQLSMLPEAPPQISWLDLATISLPASEVGGDYYDFFEIDDDRLALVIGDVAGHGLASGIVLSGIRSCLTLLAQELREPEKVLTRLHEMVRLTSRHRMLVTLSILVIDRVARTASIASAGHPPALIRTKDKIVEIGPSSPPLGTGLLTVFEVETVDLPDEFELILQTDGVYEATDEEGEPFGFDRLGKTLQRDDLDSSSATRDAILREIWEYKGKSAQRDDITLIVARPRQPGWQITPPAPIQSLRE